MKGKSRIMLKKLRIKNFKGIKDLTIRFTPLTMLIGENSCGKSTVLQALDFLCNVATRDVDEYLKDRGWSFDEIKSQFASKSDYVEFVAVFEIDGESIIWQFAINEQNDSWDIEEQISSEKANTYYLSFGMSAEDYPINFSEFNMASSALKLLAVEGQLTLYECEEKYSPYLYSLKKFLVNSNSFELLSPHRMLSHQSRGKVKDMGKGGEKLSAYIHAMSSSKKSLLSKTVSEFIGYDVKISTSMKVHGWVEMFIEEKWAGSTVKIKKKYISEGLLRIIAFAVIVIDLKPTFQEYKELVMFDEIEDGINPNLAEKLIKSFKKTTCDSKKQIIVTSHSPVMVNYLEPEEVVYMWREETGKIRAKSLFSTVGMQETLDCFNPGEVWLNYSKAEILELLNSSNQEECDE